MDWAHFQSNVPIAFADPASNRSTNTLKESFGVTTLGVASVWAHNVKHEGVHLHLHLHLTSRPPVLSDYSFMKGRKYLLQIRRSCESLLMTA